MLSLRDINRALFDTNFRHESPIHHPRLIGNANYFMENRKATIHTDETTISPSSDYAYVFLIGGVHPSRIAYKGFLYNTMLAIRMLRRYGSTADMVVYMQVSLNSTNNETYSSLPLDEVRWLTSMGADILHLPTTTLDSLTFTEMLLNKFRILQLVQYRRVLHLDSDTLPLGNLDYLFALSDPKDLNSPTLLRPNVVIASKPETEILRFLVEPWTGGWEEASAFFRSHEPSDGRLLDSFKHVLRNTSIVLEKQVETWEMAEDSTHTSTMPLPVLRNVCSCAFLDYAPIPVWRAKSCQPCDFDKWHYTCHPPYRDAIHFAGNDKPWRHQFQSTFFQNDTYSSVDERFPFWFFELRILNAELELGLDFDNWNDHYLQGLQEPLYGNKAHHTNINTMHMGGMKWTRSDSFTAANIIPNSTFAYCFLVGSIHEDRIAYKGFLWNVLLSVQMLQRLGSIADFVIYTQMAPDSKLPGLPSDDVRILQSMGIHIVTLPKPPRSTFAELMFNKFHALQLTQYRRIMYLDSDILPISNLDYLFQLSDPEDTTLPTLFQPNVIHATQGEPANGGMFVMHPAPGAHGRLQEIIKRQLEEAKTLPYPHFDMGRGWGHDFVEAGDQWEAAERNGTSWNFHGGFADQGLAFYFFKYVVQEATAILGRRVINWSPGPNKMPVMTRTFDHLTLLNYSKPISDLGVTCVELLEGGAHYNCYAPYRDMVHYMGSSKPWQKPFKSSVVDSSGPLYPPKAKYRIWYVELKKLNERLNMGLDFENWNTIYFPELEKSPLGYYPLFIDNHHRIFGHNMSEPAGQKDMSGGKPVPPGGKW